MAQVIVVRDTNDPGDQEIALKVYDPRFMIIQRQGMKKPWDAQSEELAARARQDHPIPAVLRESDIPMEMIYGDPIEKENACVWAAYLQYSNEVKAYRQLEPLQGKEIPRFLGHGTLTVATLQLDPEPRFVIPNVVLLEFISGAVAMRDADSSMLQLPSPLVYSLIETARRFRTFGVIHNDPNYGNFLLTPNRAVIIDFGSAYFKGEDFSEEVWEKAVSVFNDVSFTERRIADKLGIPWKSLPG
ncbi:hypothetical protein QCA50_016712 [Cerrena zonata]|uniref:non-specific serine/threonine protein kinase n=1 Tax=Cerrena zonata TaxID=2478898 RepID=A0AAW0FGP9_9APHY